jgi:hypothetical protein
MDFLPTLFSFLVSGSVAAAFLSVMFSGILDALSRMAYIYLGWGRSTANAPRYPQRFAAAPAPRGSWASSVPVRPSRSPSRSEDID